MIHEKALTLASSFLLQVGIWEGRTNSREAKWPSGCGGACRRSREPWWLNEAYQTLEQPCDFLNSNTSKGEWDKKSHEMFLRICPPCCPLWPLCILSCLTPLLWELCHVVLFLWAFRETAFTGKVSAHSYKKHFFCLIFKLLHRLDRGF